MSYSKAIRRGLNGKKCTVALIMGALVNNFHDDIYLCNYSRDQRKGKINIVIKEMLSIRKL